MSNPVEIMYSWQALVIAGIASGLTQFVKTAIDLALGNKKTEARRPSLPRMAGNRVPALLPPPTIKGAIQEGKQHRSHIKWLDGFLLPALPPLFGFIVAAVLPVYPEALQVYIDLMTEKQVLAVGMAWTITGPWGAACGQLADYVVSKAKRTMRQEGDR
jgi:hypothetical protein